MALDQSALLEVLDALRNADAGDRVRQAAETIYQALIEGVDRADRRRSARAHGCSDQSAQWIAAAHRVYDGRGSAVADPQVARRSWLESMRYVTTKGLPARTRPVY